jgi:hypothetical protein
MIRFPVPDMNCTVVSCADILNGNIRILWLRNLIGYVYYYFINTTTPAASNTTTTNNN